MKLVARVLLLAQFIIFLGQPLAASAECRCAVPEWYTPFVNVYGKPIPYDKITSMTPGEDCSSRSCIVTTGGGKSVTFPCINDANDSSKGHPDFLGISGLPWPDTGGIREAIDNVTFNNEDVRRPFDKDFPAPEGSCIRKCQDMHKKNYVGSIPDMAAANRIYMDCVRECWQTE